MGALTHRRWTELNVKEAARSCTDTTAGSAADSYYYRVVAQNEVGYLVASL